MTESSSVAGQHDLQFETIAEASPAGAPGAAAATCEVCGRSIGSEYYDVNGHTACAECRSNVQALATTPRGIGPLAAAAGLGLGAGIVGAAIYYAVIALTNFEIGIVAILIGYMVGWAVRKGAGGRGGRRFQVMAVLLTYLAVGLAYTPLAIQGAREAAPSDPQKQATSVRGQANDAPPASSDPASGPDSGRRSARPLAIMLLFVTAMIVALPVLVVIGSFPSGLISAFIIFIGMRQAWRMTATPTVVVSGPYRVGAAPPAVEA